MLQGIFAILDEESAFPRASDLSFTSKCTAALSNHVSRGYKAPRSDRDMKFGITHYAGEVEYEVRAPCLGIDRVRVHVNVGARTIMWVHVGMYGHERLLSLSLDVCVCMQASAIVINERCT